MSRPLTQPRTHAKFCEWCKREFNRDLRNTWAYWERARFCSPTCSGFSRSAEAAKKRPTIQAEFERRVQQSDGCWEWTGLKDKDGYGLLSYARRNYRANKLALQFDGRPVPAGMYACHTCDNPGCVRPSHLYPGTPQQNADDAYVRDRNQRGERHYAAKLRDNDIKTTRSSFETDEDIARIYGVSRSNISQIRSRKTWRHVQ